MIDDYTIKVFARKREAIWNDISRLRDHWCIYMRYCECSGCPLKNDDGHCLLNDLAFLDTLGGVNDGEA